MGNREWNEEYGMNGPIRESIPYPSFPEDRGVIFLIPDSIPNS